MIKKAHYGYPVLFFLYSVLLTFFVIIVIIFFIIWNISYFTVIIIILCILSTDISIIRWKKIIDSQRKIAINKMIYLANIKGDENVLDLGTGAGIIAIHFAKHLITGKSYGLDRWRWPYSIIVSYLLPSILFGLSAKKAKKNAESENVLDKCIFINGSFTEKLEFSDNYFDIICSAQSLYFITDKKQQIYTYSEINRVLKKGGKIIFYEPVNYHYNWNIDNVKIYFEQIDYLVNIILLSTPKKWIKQCILYGEKQI